MPTYGRPVFVNESVAIFMAQDYPAKELIIFNDCVGQTFLGDLPQVRIVNVQRRYPTFGEKRNAAVELAEGPIIAVWDDDDVSLPWRLSFSVCQMRHWNTPFYRPAEFWAFWGEAELHDNQSVPGWISNPNTTFTKELWRRVGGYPAVGVGEDARFFERVHRELGRATSSRTSLRFPMSKTRTACW
jgi:glycosyltransferase involved in cell wall biosynthesis